MKQLLLNPILPFQGANLMGTILTQGDAIGLEYTGLSARKNKNECPISNIQRTRHEVAI
jgi:hypothetical protein